VGVEAEPAGTWERHAFAACAPLGRYRRREPERTLLHAVVRERLEPFLARARERSAHGRGLPAFVEGAFRAYLGCGILARGFVRIRCPGCGFERLVGFSCKGPVCPSCNARRMEDAAQHLSRGCRRTKDDGRIRRPQPRSVPVRFTKRERGSEGSDRARREAA
jgi:hypothetical protein